MAAVSYTPKENFLRLVKNEDPYWIGNPFPCFNCAGESGINCNGSVKVGQRFAKVALVIPGISAVVQGKGIIRVNNQGL